jgi:RND family efflux transporter MFP subunit
VHADLEAVERADVYPELSGVVQRVLAREGDWVAKGQVIVQLLGDERALTVEVKKVAKKQMEHKLRQSELAARELEEAALTKTLLLEKAQSEFQRIEDLFNAGGVSEGIISKEEFAARKYVLEEARILHRTAVLHIDKAAVERALAEQNLRQAELELKTAEYQLSRMELRSPIEGAVSYLVLKPGELVGPATKAFSVVNPDRLEARLFVPQRELNRLHKGQRVEIECEVFDDQRFEGLLEVINPTVDADSGMVRVIVAIDDPRAKGFLKPGMFVNGKIVLESREHALLVSKQAILYENQQPILFLVENERARRYVVRTGYSDRDRVEIRGLERPDGTVLGHVPDDAALVIQGHNNLKDGARVEVDRGGGSS